MSPKPTPALLPRLTELGEQLPVTERPAPGEVAAVLGAVIRYIQTGGSLEPPAKPVSEPQARAESEQDAEIARLHSQVEQMAVEAQARVQADPVPMSAPVPAIPVPGMPVPGVETPINAPTPQAPTP